MSVQTIDAKMLQKMFLAGAKGLEAKKEYINELNVFPVPDGDTGTNMTMTIMAAAKDVANLQNPTLTELGKAISSGSLRGARGNSGVIMSQIFRGFVKELKGLDIIDVTALGNGVQHAAETAYKAVMKPKEGTILTVAKAGADKSMDLLVNGDTDDIIKFCDEVAAEMEEALLQTPELLPVLKQAGVVDSGGEGLMTFIRGALDALKGKATDFTVNTGTATRVVNGSVGASEEEDIRFGYCTEFIIMLERGEDVVESQLKEYLQKIGDCVVVVADDDIVKVHVHTNDPGLAIQKALTYGSLTSMKIDNMREEHQEKVIRDAQKASELASAPKKEEPRKENGFIAVAAGDGLADIFRDLGVDYVIEGGQTMNPSTDDVLSAIEQVNADNIFVLPNNGNIILAANQAKNLTEDKEVYVVPSKNIPQGIAAMISFVSGRSAAENAESMEEEMQLIKSGQVTYAVRDTNMDGKDIKQGDFMGLTDKTIVSVGSDLQGTAKELIESLLDEDSELVSLYYGSDATKEQAEQLAEDIESTHEDVEVEVQYGGQPVYSYFISVE
ncbi:DAK2 domain-containing protein [Clostridium sp. OM05-6BH]|uniref:DAK2 domain-containing protein n=1 Tax=unclassified Clostridium TaxID=2614128 RepID=UPI000E4B0127|nr:MULTISPECIES: DAK2 domain-containing protein [unclassified Clostridium]RHV17477.1 DAK2 domain-containing protein [Clostridium sp. OM05-9BH]RHV21623.1 DAK2 domain-containing protein [Clostridium sp. OM05-6BH]